MTLLTESGLPLIGKTVPVPLYDRSVVRQGIVHFGVGAFHRSHQAMFIDRLLSAGVAQDWGICGIGILPSDARMRDVLAAQDALYTLVLKHPGGELDVRVIGSIVQYLFAPDDFGAVIDKLTDPHTKIVSLTVTEGGYSVNNATGEFDPRQPDTVHDLQPDVVPQTVFGLITEALRIRRRNGIPPFTVMSCDNIQGNGHVAKTALTSFAHMKDPELSDWIASHVAFPSSMVDRITPATTDQDRADLALRCGIEDQWPVVSESFEQWVLEDRFTLGRPMLERAGVQLVDDVEPYELMKLRLLNASHQVMSYLGILAGFSYVHEVCQDPVFARFLMSYMTDEASPTLKPVPGIDVGAYRKELLIRFSSPALCDTLARQAVDGSERIPKFLLPVVRDQLAAGGEIRLSALVIAAYARFLEGSDEQGRQFEIHDKRLAQLSDAVARDKTDPGSFLGYAELFGELRASPRFVAAYTEARESLRVHGAFETVRRFVG